MKAFIFTLIFLGSSFILGVLLPIYLLHIKYPNQKFWFNVLPIIFIMAFANWVDVMFFSQYNTFARVMLLFIFMGIGLFLSALSIVIGYRLWYGEKPPIL
jgi:hypothetical protein